MSAKLSSTLAGMALFQFLFLLLVLGPLLGQRLVTRLALEDAPPTLDERGGHRFEEDALGRRLNNGLGAILNVELLAKPGGDNDLAFGGEPNGIYFCYRAHGSDSDLCFGVRQSIKSRKVIYEEEFYREERGRSVNLARGATGA